MSTAIVAFLALLGPARAVEPPPEPVLIGELGSFTGYEAMFGISTDRGVQLAVAEANAAGGVNGRPIVVRTFDDGGKAAQAAAGVEHLITEEHVVAVIGEVASSLTLAGGAVAQRHGVPMLSPSSTHVAVTQLGDRVFRTCFIDDVQGAAAARFARTTLHLDRVAVVSDSASPYSTAVSGAFVDEFRALGGEVAWPLGTYVGGAETAFAGPIKAIRKQRAEAVFVPGYYPDVAAFATAARARKVTVPLIGTDGWDSTELPLLAGAAIDGSYYVNHYASDDTHAATQDFVARYRQANDGDAPDSLAALGYDAAVVLIDALRRAPTLAGADVAKALRETGQVPTATGFVSFDADRNPRKAVVVLQLQDGAPRYVASVEP